MSRLRTAYVITANTAILWLLAEAGAHLALTSYEAMKPSFGYEQLSEPARGNYAHMSPADVDELWRDSLALRFKYAPIVGFIEGPFASRFVNVDDRGIRANGRPRAPIDGAIWFFGGSTTFGFGVADHETIPAYFEAAVRAPVINFGTRGHYSAVENRMLNHYLRLGFTPAAAIFLDGINEFCEPDLDEDELGDVVARSQQGYRWEIGRPVRYLATRIAGRIRRAMGEQRPVETLKVTCRAAGTQNSLAVVHARLLREREALCEVYQVECHTFIQPFAGLHGRHDETGYQDSHEARYLRALYGHLEPVWRGADVMFVTTALDRLQQHAYIDTAHYGAKANAAIAEAIALRLQQAGATTTASSTSPLR